MNAFGGSVPDKGGAVLSREVNARKRSRSQECGAVEVATVTQVRSENPFDSFAVVDTIDIEGDEEEWCRGGGVEQMGRSASAATSHEVEK